MEILVNYHINSFIHFLIFNIYLFTSLFTSVLSLNVLSFFLCYSLQVEELQQLWEDLRELSSARQEALAGAKQVSRVVFDRFYIDTRHP